MKPQVGVWGYGHGLTVVALLAAATLAIHGWSLTDGLYLDDHWHRMALQDRDWSLRALIETATIQPDRFIHTWWQERSISWHYLRPLAILVAKTVYVLSGGSVLAWHAISVVLHLANALMVHRLAWWLTRRRSWSVVAALLFLVYSHSVFAVAWLAAQNIVLQTALTLGSLLCYVRASGLNLYAAAPRPARDTGISKRSESRDRKKGRAVCEDRVNLLMDLPTGETGEQQQVASVLGERPSSLSHIQCSVPGLRRGLLVGAGLLWLAALLCRENAIVLPVILAGCDLAFGGWHHLRARWRVYAVLGVMAAGFALIRLVLFSHPMPDFYFQRPDGDGLRYLSWLAVKLMHFYTAVIWLSPMSIGPSGRYHPFTEVPGDCLLMAGILVVLLGGYVLAARRARGWWLWPLWILLALLPVAPVLATPHSGYMPSVGFALGMVLGAALRVPLNTGRAGRISKGVAIWFLIATTIYMPIYRPMWTSHRAAERMTIQQVLDDPPGRTATELFFINLPFTNIYAEKHLKHAWDLDGCRFGRGPMRDYLGPVGPSFDPAALERGPAGDFRVHVLTYAPDLLRMDQPCEIEQLDGYRLRVSISDRPYFSGALGRFLIESMRNEGRFEQGEVVSSELFDTTITRADEQGVWELVFTFHEPLASERYTFYVGTLARAATRLRFRPPGYTATMSPLPPPQTDTASIEAIARLIEGGATDAAEFLFATVTAGESAEVRAAARAALDRTVIPAMAALAAPEYASLTGDTPTPADWERARQWWFRAVDEATLLSILRDREHYAALRWTRDRLHRIREIARWIIQTDLYLTGPPYPGPR